MKIILDEKWKNLVLGEKLGEAERELENYWFHCSDEETLITNLKVLRNEMIAGLFFEVLGERTMSGAVYVANRMVDKWWWNE